jgi:proton glutamate symport protein
MIRNLSLTAWIFIALAVGIAIGIFFPAFGVQLTPISNIFLRLIKSIIAPLLFGTLVSGIAGTGSVKAMGRIGAKSIIYFEVATSIALFIGLGCVNLFRPGDGVPLDQTAKEISLAKPMTGVEIIEHTFPTSVIDSMAKGDVLQLVVFCFIFGMACAAIGERARPVVNFCEGLAEVMFTYTRYVMYLAPFGVGAAIAATVGKNGVGVLFGLGKLVGTLYLALILFVVIVLGGVITLLRIPMRRFIAAVKEPWLLAFSTASSEAALPKAMLNMEVFGVPKHIVSFVIPTGYSFNLDGSTLYLAVASVFVAQAAGVALTFPTQIAMMLTLMLTSKGVAAVPRASLVILAGTLATFNLPAAGVFVILGVDAVMDMARTSVNVLGNCLACAVVARWEGYPLMPEKEKTHVIAV